MCWGRAGHPLSTNLSGGRLTGKLAGLRAQLDDAFHDYRIKLSFDTGHLEAVLGRQLKTPGEIFGGLDQVAGTTGDLRQAASTIATASQKIGQLRAEIAQADEDADGFWHSFARGIGGTHSPMAEQVTQPSGRVSLVAARQGGDGRGPQ